jgi:hypothetical protein
MQINLEYGNRNYVWPETTPLDCSNHPAPPLQMAVSNTGSLVSDDEDPCASLRSFHFPLSPPATPTALPSSSSGEVVTTSLSPSPPSPPHSSPAPVRRLSMSRKWPSDVGTRTSARGRECAEAQWLEKEKKLQPAVPWWQCLMTNAMSRWTAKRGSYWRRCPSPPHFSPNYCDDPWIESQHVQGKQGGRGSFCFLVQWSRHRDTGRQTPETNNGQESFVPCT